MVYNPEAGSISRESEFLSKLFGEFVPEQLVELVRSPSGEKFVQIGMLFVLTATVGAGYGYALFKETVYQSDSIASVARRKFAYTDRETY